MRRTLLTLTLSLSLLAVCSCGNSKKESSSQTSGTSLLYCDESFENIMEQEIDVFEYIYPKAHVLCRYGTEAEAIDSLKALTYRTIVIPRALTDDELAYIKRKGRTARQARIAVDAVALIVNPENKINALSEKEISEILSGETATWDQLEPGLPEKPIAILFDKVGSSMTNYMRDSLLNGKKFGPNVHAQGSLQGVIDAVKKDKNAIGVIGVSWLTTDLKAVVDVDSLAVDAQDMATTTNMQEVDDKVSNSGVKVLGVMRNDDRQAYRPFQKDIYSGDYPLTRQIWMATVSPGGSPGAGFYTFVTSNTGQKLILKTGVMPARMQINVVELVP